MRQFDDIYDTVGRFGRFQMVLSFFIVVFCGIVVFQQLGNTFYSASAEHYCKVYSNQTFMYTSPVKNCTIPYTTKGGDIVWNKCTRYDVNISRKFFPDICLPRSNEMGCDQGWVYDKTWYENTVVFEYDLVCDNDWMKQLSKSIVPVGNIIGVLAFGQMSDTYGRRPVSIITLVLTVIITIATTFSPTYTSFVVGQFFLGVFAISLGICGQVLVTEIVGIKYRAMCIAFGHVNWCLCYMLLGAIAWLCNGKWRMIQLITGLIWMLFLPYIFFVTESPMWLIQKHRYDDCVTALKRFAHFNRRSLSDDIFEEEKTLLKQKPDGTKKPKYTLFDLLRTRNLRIKTAIMCLNWFSCGFVYYGISLNTDRIGDNPYTTFILSGFVEIPGRLLAWFLMGYIGRRWSLCGCQVIGGVALILSTIPNLPALTIAMVMLTKFCIGAVATNLFVYGLELFPTVVRSIGMGLTSMCFGIGSMVSPYVILLEDIWGPLPFVIMGCMSVVPGLTVPVLPETRDVDLPGTIEDVESNTWTMYNGRDKDTQKQSQTEEKQPLFMECEPKNMATEDKVYGTLRDKSRIDV